MKKILSSDARTLAEKKLALYNLGEIETEESKRILCSFLTFENVELSIIAVQALKNHEYPVSIERIRPVIKETQNSTVFSNLARYTVDFNLHDLGGSYRERLVSENPMIVYMALWVVKELKLREAHPELLSLLGNAEVPKEKTVHGEILTMAECSIGEMAQRVIESFGT